MMKVKVKPGKQVMVRVQISRIYGQTSCSVVQARTMMKSLNSNAVTEGRRNGF